jgi:N-carbamoylputrescine amidase
MHDGRRLAASYANFLILNGAVLMPAYGDPADAAAAVLAAAFPDREIVPVPVPSLDLAERQPALRHHAIARGTGLMSTERSLRVALVQEFATTATPTPTSRRIEQRVAEAAAQGARLVLLQELHNGAYFCQHESVDEFDLAEPIPGPSTERLAALAKRHGVVLVSSLFEKRAPGLYHNTAVVFDADGRLAGKYRKMHIPDDPGFYEKFYFTPGDLGFDAHRHAGGSPGRAGVLGPVVSGRRAPDGAGRRGAAAVSRPRSAGIPDDAQDEKIRQRDAWVLSHRGHAVANGLPVLSCNRVGHEPSPLGASGIVSGATATCSVRRASSSPKPAPIRRNCCSSTST